jgi:hypothetical protein
MRIRDATPISIRTSSPIMLRPVLKPTDPPPVRLRFQAERKEGFVILPGDVDHLAEVAGRLNSNKPLTFAERRQLATIIEVVVRAGKPL